MRRREREEAPALPTPRAESTIGPAAGMALRRYTPAEVQAQEQAVEQLLVQGVTDRQVMATVSKRLGVSANRVYVLIARLRQRWVQESELSRASHKEAQLRRIGGRIVQLDQRIRGTRDERTGQYVVDPVTKPHDLGALHAALHKWESLLADIQGTKAPVKVEVSVQVSQAILHIIAELTPEQVAEMMAEQEEQERKARLFDAARTVEGTAAE